MNTARNEKLAALIRTCNQRNLVYNHNFTLFSQQQQTGNQETEEVEIDYGVPDGWLYTDPGPLGSINYMDHELVIQTSNDDSSQMTFKQMISEFPRWRRTLQDQTVNACFEISSSTGSHVTVSIDDGINQSDESRVFLCDESYVFELEHQVDSNAAYLSIMVSSESNEAMIGISQIYANVGPIAIANLPCVVTGVIGQTQTYLSTQNAPATEISLCEPMAELPETMTRLSTVLNGRYGWGDNERSKLPDVRGYFMRAWDHGASVDPNSKKRTALGDNPETKGDVVGSRQLDEFKRHHHTIPFTNSTLKPTGDSAPINDVLMEEQETSEVGGDETRPKNVYQLMTMKWA